MNLEERKKAAVDFLNLVVAGQIEEAYRKHIDLGGKHHNAYTPAGFPALKKGMMENHAQFPQKKFDIKRVLADGDLVATHSHVVLRPGELELSVVHMFRFQGDKIVELWDCAQQVPADSTNQDGLF